ncbi:MAG: UvrB/UvrC motif-containing protein [Candidatus Omnitrophota bacterium]|nr:UvrB/UvrC motif-containing protein [Candidatus Omnitrophota bacterium]
MKCEICGEREATVHLTEVINDKVTKLHICEHCAKAKSSEMQSHFGLSDLLSGLMDFVPAVSEEQVTEGVKTKCPVCGMTYYDFQRSGRLGCGKCYETFAKDLSELLRKIHGSDKHVGKMPFKGEDALKDQQDLQRLKNELNELVRAEEFEKAVVLRDRIKELEEKLKD